MRALALPQTQSTAVDNYLTEYCESTLKENNTYIDIELFRQIPFTKGVPLIVIDLLVYLVDSRVDPQL